MKTSLLIGGLIAVPLGYALMMQYAVATPQDPQKAIGYLIIAGYAVFVWAMIALLSEGVRAVRSGMRVKARAFLGPSAIGLLLALGILWKIQDQETRLHRLTTTAEREILTQEARKALKRENNAALKAIAGNIHTPAETLTELSTVQEPSVLTELAGNPATPQSVLKALSTHQSYLVKMELLRNPSLSREIRQEMQRDQSSRIRKAARTGPKASGN